MNIKTILRDDETRFVPGQGAKGRGTAPNAEPPGLVGTPSEMDATDHSVLTC